MQVLLNLKRAQTAEALCAFDVLRDIFDYSASAGVTLFVADALALSSESRLDAVTRRAGFDKLGSLVLSNRRVMLSALAGGVSCTLRSAAFATMLAFLSPATGVEDECAVLQWAADHCLRGNVGAPPWSLEDLMFALEALVVHWENLCRRVWSEGGERAFCDNGAPLGLYLQYVWLQCRRFAVDTSVTLSASVHTLPYGNADNPCVGVSANTVTVMCEVWRQVEAQRRFVWESAPTVTVAACDAAEALFLRVFAFEKRQLNVNKFREQLRARLARRFLMLGDEEIWSAQQGGKEVVVDLVVGARCTPAMPGFLQAVASSWTFERMQTVPAVRDCLYRFMADSAFMAKTQVDFSSRYFEDVGIVAGAAPRQCVWMVKRLCHGFVVVWNDATGNRTAVTSPVPFAVAFGEWARRAFGQGGYQYGPEVTELAEKFARASEGT